MNDNAINLTPEAKAAINEMCSASNISDIIVVLKYTEDKIAKIAHDEQDGTLDYLFRDAYDLRLIREQFEKLEKKLGYDPKYYRD